MVWQVLDSYRGLGMTEEEGEDGKFIEGEKMVKPSTVGELRESGYETLSIKAELRRNLVRKLEGREPLFEGILGYEDTVMPQLENALLAGQDIIVLGERGQAKSRMIRGLVSLLDEEVPVVEGCEINDDPYAPVCRTCKDKVRDLGDETPVTWLHRDDRYAEKLATPDVTMADLIGDIDPIKVTEGRYLSDELTVHYGLVPRTNRGIFCINELPDLAERLQVGLFNLMQERDIQVKGYQIRLPLDILVVASANPEDYTNRGRIITPLKDRYGAQIRTHYPQTPEVEIAIMEGEARRFEDGRTTLVPHFMKEIVAQVSALARKSPDVNQRSGVSVRISTANYESIMGNAMRRALHTGEKAAAPRISDLTYLKASTLGKLELETVEDERSEQVLDGLVDRAVANVFARYFNVTDFAALLTQFQEGTSVGISDMAHSRTHTRLVKKLGGFDKGLKKLECDKKPAAVASGVEFILEGLHLNRKLNKVTAQSGEISYEA